MLRLQFATVISTPIAKGITEHTAQITVTVLDSDLKRQINVTISPRENQPVAVRYEMAGPLRYIKNADRSNFGAIQEGESVQDYPAMFLHSKAIEGGMREEARATEEDGPMDEFDVDFVEDFGGFEPDEIEITHPTGIANWSEWLGLEREP